MSKTTNVQPADVFLIMEDDGDFRKMKTNVDVLTRIENGQETDDEYEVREFFNMLQHITEAKEAMVKGEAYATVDVDGANYVGVSNVSYDAAKKALVALKKEESNAARMSRP